MRGLLSKAPGRPDTLERTDLPDPVAGPGQVVIAIRASAIHHPDVPILKDGYQFRPWHPFARGGEVAGTIGSGGDGVTGWTVGDRMIAVTSHGGMVDKVAVPAAVRHRLPPYRSFESGAVLLTYATMIHAPVDRGRIAAGGVGPAAVEPGKAFGARTVAAVSSAERRRWRRHSRRRWDRAGRTSCSIRSATTMPNRRCARSRGRGAVWSSAFRRRFPACR